MLVSLGSDLLTGFTARCEKSRLKLRSAEISVSGEVENPLVFLNVVGEAGSPALESAEAALYVAADCEDAELEAVWEQTLERSPLYQTLVRCAPVDARLVIL